MQKKFDDLCEQMYSSEDQPTIHTHKGSSESDEFREYMMSETKVANFCSTVCSLPQLNPDCGVPPLSGNLSNWSKDPGAELCMVEAFTTSHPSMGEPEERRMSDLSDFSSVSSSVDIHQLRSTLAEEQNIYNLRKECQQKDAIIDKLTAEAHESSIAHSKRISELEEIIRTKNLIITKLKKAKPASEVIQPMREQRPSTALNTENKTTLAMTTNILYDMSSSSSSSSDSDTPVHQKDRQPQASVKSDSQPSAKSLGYSNLPPNKRPKHRPASPVKASYIVSRADSTGALRPKRLVSASAVASQKRWV
ncbi:uncharacterized protein A4U43_C05F29970 [Asparagus officinalis]|uniref:Uncharacterized protein n=1 Tax=Asparagus officinalis TaxID=4686 RepID=A0A5P1EW56_ASPOF|nr:uncharacterized protein LOC109842472 [Asparagus officinalis]ONK70074.1 uncharacterized protein A4U43_C05F29970 [Asparagus officinalis]